MGVCIGLSSAMRRHKWRAGIAIVGVSAMLLTAGLFVAAEIWESVDDRKATMTTDGPYRATVQSLNSHPLPDWYAGAKLGVMIHWGPYSVPGYAPKGTFAEVLATDYDNAMVSHPYAEDYANAMKDPDSPTGRHHAEHYGAKPYEDFAKQFEAGLAQWDADTWARTFHDAGARYVVMVAKYADGYSLWPTAVVNPHQPDWHSRRDLVGELAAAVRKQGMKFGLYYSGGVDWTFQRTIVRTLGDYAYLPYDDDYADYATAQVHELIQRYEPDLLWNDILWPTGQKRLSALMADYYNTVPDGVLNDRWTTTGFWHRAMGLKPMRWAFDTLMKQAIKRRPELTTSNITAAVGAAQRLHHPGVHAVSDHPDEEVGDGARYRELVRVQPRGDRCRLRLPGTATPAGLHQGGGEERQPVAERRPERRCGRSRPGAAESPARHRRVAQHWPRSHL